MEPAQVHTLVPHDLEGVLFICKIPGGVGGGRNPSAPSPPPPPPSSVYDAQIHTPVPPRGVPMEGLSVFVYVLDFIYTYLSFGLRKAWLCEW